MATVFWDPRDLQAQPDHRGVLPCQEVQEHPPFDKQIDEIMDHFDFGKVHRAMMAVGWEWYSLEGSNRVPSEAELRQTARRLLRDLSEDKDYRGISTGGFDAQKEDGFLSLRFVLADWDGECA